MKTKKGEYGYIAGQKKKNLMVLLVLIVIAIGIFLTGYFLHKTRANIFTVMAVLMVLPGAKRVVALVVMVPKKSLEKSRYDKVKELAGDSTLFVDYVFSSTEKIMHLDYVLIRNGNVLGVVAKSKQDVEYMKKYITDCVQKTVSSFHVKIVDTDEQFEKQLEKLTQVEVSPEQEEKVVDLIRGLGV